MTETPAPHFRILRLDETAPAPRQIGLAAWSAEDHRLVLLDAEEAMRPFLDRVFGKLNRLDKILADVAPPPDAELGAVYALAIPRTDPGFRAALAERLADMYRIRLEPEEPRAEV